MCAYAYVWYVCTYIYIYKYIYVYEYACVYAYMYYVLFIYFVCDNLCSTHDAYMYILYAYRLYCYTYDAARPRQNKKQNTNDHFTDL